MVRYADMLSVDAPLLLGVQLMPLTLGHVLHLQENDSLFVSPIKFQVLESTDPKENFKRLQGLMVELLLAIAICSRTYDEFNELKTIGIDDGNGKRLKFGEYFGEWRKAVDALIESKQVNLLETAEILNRYIERAYFCPDYQDLRENPNQSGSSDNWTHTVTLTLCSEMNTTEEKVRNQPLLVSLFHFYKIAERNGLIHLENELETKLMRDALATEKAK